MAIGAFEKSIAQVVIATTGVAGRKKMEGTPSGTVCFAWGFRLQEKTTIFTCTKQFNGTRKQIIKEAATYALFEMITHFKKINPS